jgi:DNA polymerase Ligase (LigD)
MPRFVILEHDHPLLHWDFMLEAGEVLRTWRLEMPPQSNQEVRATALPDHRIHYLDYEGPVNGNRGVVKRWDWGTFRWEADVRGRVRVSLAGERLHGTAVLGCIAGGYWLFTYTEGSEED